MEVELFVSTVVVWEKYCSIELLVHATSAYNFLPIPSCEDQRHTVFLFHMMCSSY